MQYTIIEHRNTTWTTSKGAKMTQKEYRGTVIDGDTDKAVMFGQWDTDYNRAANEIERIKEVDGRYKATMAALNRKTA